MSAAVIHDVLELEIARVVSRGPVTYWRLMDEVDCDDKTLIHDAIVRMVSRGDLVDMPRAMYGLPEGV